MSGDMFGRRKPRKPVTLADKVRRLVRLHMKRSGGFDVFAPTVAAELKVSVEEVVEAFKGAVRYPVIYEDNEGVWLSEDGA